MMETAEKARLRIRTFIENNMNEMFDDNEVHDSDNIFEKGFVSSLFAMQLLNFIEQDFAIEVKDEDILLSNFSSVDQMLCLIEKVKGGSYA
ncbi:MULTISPECIES: phosphopantetheine-binding protein [unclassified Paenibacillus]|uniref:phosphopantetheine-binding protein n=1 Tax=unclassified Paenibacillus TaxID=185978 RepID=UPI000688F8F4|nr:MULTISPECIES: phosphopantetheine-binding protein [unclassified Paenibacillus]